MGTPAVALSTFEVAVAGGCAALTRFEFVGVHGQAHGATGLAPFETRGLENLVQALALGLRFHQARARHDHGKFDVASHFLTEVLDDGGGFTHILDTAVGTRTDEHFIDVHIVQCLTWLQAHIGQGAFNRVAFVGVFFFVRVGYSV